MIFNVSGEASSFCNIPKVENVLDYKATNSNNTTITTTNFKWTT